MRLLQFKIKLAKHLWSMSMNGHSSHQMKGANIFT